MVLALLVLGISKVPVDAQIEEIYFPETGHWVRGPFLRFYQGIDEPDLLFGNPITDEFEDPVNGQMTQYFERARFDSTPLGRSAQIELAPLGSLIYEDISAEVEIRESRAFCRTFEATRKKVCYAFLDFYDHYYGESVFGYPISNLEWREGRFVQYFENARMEWHPGLPAGERVVLTNLGKVYFDTRLGNEDYLNPKESTAVRDLITELKVDAFVTNPLIPPGEKQTVTVIVKNQHYVPVQGAMIRVNVVMPDGMEEVYRPTSTDIHGITTLIFTTPGDIAPNETIRIQVEARVNELTQRSNTWFRIWW